LGIEIDRDLKFSRHINNVVTRAYQRLAVLFRGFCTKDSKFLCLAYKVYIRPILEYCTQVWNPYLQKDIILLERVQRYFTRRIQGMNCFKYEERLRLLKLDRLELRRLKFDLVMYYKIIHGFIDLDKNLLFKMNFNSTRGNDFKICIPICKTSLHMNVFSNRALNCWNSLPNDIVSSVNVELFKSRLDKYDLTKYLSRQ